jgi:hypothetical protein
MLHPYFDQFHEVYSLVVKLESPAIWGANVVGGV